MSNPTHIKRALQLLACGLFCHRAEAAQAPPAAPAKKGYVQWYYEFDDSKSWKKCDEEFSRKMQEKVDKGVKSLKAKRANGPVYYIVITRPPNNAPPYAQQFRVGTYGSSREITSVQPDADGLIEGLPVLPKEE